MTFTPAPPLTTPKPPSTGISMSVAVAEKSGKASVRLSLNAGAQKRLFGRQLDPSEDRVDFLFGKGEHEGFARLRVHSNGEHQLGKTVHAGVSVRVGHWDLLPAGKCKADSCKEVSPAEQEADAFCVTIKLPPWASPRARSAAARNKVSSAQQKALGGQS